VAAVLYYLWRKKQNLIKPMWDGDKELNSPTVPSRDDAVSRLTALAVLGLCAGLVAWIVQLGS
jgi:hypothetical protein